MSQIIKTGLKHAKYMRDQMFNIFLPPACVLCAAPLMAMDGLCSTCWRDLSFIEGAICRRTGMAMPYDLGENTLSLVAQLRPPPYKAARAAFEYEKTARRLIIRQKFGDRPDIAPFLAQFMYRAATELIADSDIIIAVPLHRLRILQRRFNQAAELARAFARLSGLPLQHAILHRQNWTRQQVGLSRSTRLRNLRNAFVIRKNQRPRIKNKRVLLIDDVLTTGTTAETCTRIMLRAGAKHVNVLTAARVSLPETIAARQ